MSGAIDCDVHLSVPGIAALTPFLEPYWREQVAVRGTDGLELASYPPSAPDARRADWRQEPTDLAALRRHVFDRFGAERAIGHVLYGAPALFNRHFATVLARATNDWVGAEWLDREPRLCASITVAAQDPAAAALEIERCAADRRFVQVLLFASGDAPLGLPQFWPIYAAAERHRLPIGIHAGSLYRHPTSGNGWPSFHLEDVVLRPHAFQGQLLSLVHEGVFAKFPALRFVLLEAGFTWLPNFMWRANKTWRGVRMEVPWVDRPPAELIRERVRVTLQPGDAPPDAESMARILDQLGSDDMLLYASDWPHWQFDGDDPFPPGFSPERRQRIRRDNPLALYPLPQEALA